MSSVWGISKNLLWNKMKAITLILFIDLMINLAIVQFMGRQYSGYLLEKTTFSALSTLMIAVIYLVKINEENLVHNKYRLVPITDLNLYLSNLVTSCLAFFYVVILDFAIYSGTRYVLNIPISDLNSAELLEIRLKVITLFGLGVIVVWSLSTLIHFVVNIIGNLFTRKNLKITWLIYSIIVLLIASAMTFFTAILVSKLSTYKYIGLPNHVFLKGSAIYAVTIIFLASLNTYLLKNWMETNR